MSQQWNFKLSLGLTLYHRDSEESAPAEFPPEQPDVDNEADDAENYGAEEAEMQAALEQELEETNAKARENGEDSEMGGTDEQAKVKEEDAESEAGSEDLEAESSDEDDEEEDDEEGEGEGEEAEEDAEMADGEENKENAKTNGEQKQTVIANAQPAVKVH